MNISEILITKYPAEWQLGKFGFKNENDGLGIVISHWDMTIPQPTYDQIKSYEAQINPVFVLNGYKETVLQMIENLIKNTAISKGYSDVLSCASYANSTVEQWSSEANAFIAWRDAVFVYCLTEFEKAQNGEREIISPEDFLSELPKITWPE